MEKIQGLNEGWTSNELDIIAGRCRWFSRISMVVSIILAFVAIILLFSSEFIQCIVIQLYCILCIGLSLLIHYWGTQIEINKEDDDAFGMKEYVQYKKQYSILGLTYSFLMLYSSFILLVLICFWKQVALDRYLAQFGSDHKLVHEYNILLHIMIPLVIINMICQGIFVFGTYCTISNREYLRFLIYIFNTLFLISSFFTLFFIDKINVEKLETIIALSKIVCVLSILVVSTSTLICNYLRKTNLYFVMGNFVILILFVYAIIQYHMFNEASNIREKYLNQCAQTIKITNQKWMQDECYCQKYLPNIDNPVCQQDRLIQTWDLVNTENVQCINLDCCGSVSYQLNSYIFISSFSFFIQLVTAFGLSVSLLQASSKQEGLNLPSPTKDFFFIFLWIIIFIAGVFTLSVLEAQPNQNIQKPSYLSDSQINQNPLAFPKNREGIIGCQPLNQLPQLQEFSFTKCNNNTQTCTPSDNAVRVSILAISLQIVITKYEDSPNLMYLSKTEKNYIFPNDTNKESEFFSIQGLFDDVAKFLNNNVQICGETNAQAQPTIKLDIYYFPFPQLNKQNDESKKYSNSGIRLLQQSSASSLASGGNFVLDDSQNKYLSDLKFYDLNLKVHGQNLNQEAEVLFYKQSDDCMNKKSIPFRQMVTNKDGNLTIYNLVEQNYHIGIRMVGYYMLCKTFNIFGKNQESDVQLVKQDDGLGQFSVILTQDFNQQQEQKFRINLGASLVGYRDKEPCNVGYFFQDKCGGMRFNGNAYQEQHIRVQEVFNGYYLFYLQFEPLSKVVNYLYISKSNGKILSTDEINQIDNSPIKDLNPKIFLYGNGQSEPILKFDVLYYSKFFFVSNDQLPPITNLVHEANLVWLTICVNGNIGDITATPLQTFWTYEKSPSFTQREFQSKQLFPTASICQQLYNKNK